MDPNTSKEYQVLLKLLRLAIGTEPMRYFGEPVEPFPLYIDWKEVIRLSYEEKVSALAVDGLKNVNYNPYERLDDNKTKELKSILTRWINDVAKTEESYNYNKEVLITLCQLFAVSGLKPIILKGYGLSLNYPIPSHRGVGDIDIIVLDEHNNIATDKALGFVANVLKLPVTEEPHHYRFGFKGIEVELHYNLTNPYWNTNREHYIVKRLDELVTQDIIPSTDVNNAYFPSINSNALYLTRHTFGHFYTASGNLRQYIDWITFLQKYCLEIDLQLIENEVTKSGMKPFFDGLNTMMCHWFKYSESHCPISKYNNLIEQLVLKDMSKTISNGRHLHQRIRYFISNRQKLKMLSGENWLHLFIESLSSTIVHRLTKH